MTLADIEEYSLRSIAILGCNIYSQITVAHVTLPKAVLSTVEIFAVYIALKFLVLSPLFWYPGLPYPPGLSSLTYGSLE